MTGSADLERVVQRALWRLPLPLAPATLLPRVMTAVGRRASAAWYERAWLDWPIGWQLASAPVAVVLATGVVAVAPSVGAALPSLLPDQLSAWTSDAAEHLAVWAGTTVVVWRVVLEPLSGWLVALVALTSVFFVGAGAVLAGLSAERMS